MFTSEVTGKANGFIKFYERLEAKNQLRMAELDEVSKMLTENAANIPMLSYLILIIGYHMTKTERCVAEVYNKFAYPSNQERINVAKEYLAQQEA